MRYLIFASILLFNSVNAQWDYDHVPLSELKRLRKAEVYYDGNMAVFIKYKNHWYEVVNTDHHKLCPCYEIRDYKDRKSLSQAISEN